MADLLVHLIRHGQAYNTHRPAADVYPENPPLTPIGVRESQRLAERLSRLKIDRLVSSPMRRSLETASIVAEATGHPVEVWANCYEYRPQTGYPSWGARELRQRYPSAVLPRDLSEENWTFGGETLEHAIARADAFLARLQLEANRTSWQQLAIITHGAFTRITLSRIFGVDFLALEGKLLFDNTSVTTAHFATAATRILSINDTSHLAGVPDLDPLLGVNR